jgi:hypothetical protein
MLLLQVRHVHANPLMRSSLASKLDLASFRYTWSQPALLVSGIAAFVVHLILQPAHSPQNGGIVMRKQTLCPTSSDKVFLQKDGEYAPGCELAITMCHHVFAVACAAQHKLRPVCAHRGKQAAVIACLHANFMHSILMSVCLCAVASTVCCVLQMLLVLV